MNARYLNIILFLVLCVGTCDASTRQGVPINAEECTEALLKDRDALPAFYEAIEQDDADKLVALIKSANWDRETKHRNTQRFLYVASFLGRMNSIEALVSQIGVDVNVSDADNHNWTALHYAVLNSDKSSRLSSFYILIKLGANIDALDAQNHKPLWYMSWFHVEQSKGHSFLSVEGKKKVVELLLNYAIEPVHIKNLFRLSNYHALYRWVNLYGEDLDRKEAVLKDLLRGGKKYSSELKNKVIYMVLHEGKQPKDVVRELADIGIVITMETIYNWVRKYREDHGLADTVSTEDISQREAEVNNRNYIIRDGEDNKHSDLLVRNASDGLYSLAIEDLLEGKDIDEILDDFPSLDRRTLEHHYRMYLLSRSSRSEYR